MGYLTAFFIGMLVALLLLPRKRNGPVPYRGGHPGPENLKPPTAEQFPWVFGPDSPTERPAGAAPRPPTSPRR